MHYLWTHPTATVEEARDLARALLDATGAPPQVGRRLPTETVGTRTYIRVLREGQSISRKMLADALGATLNTLADWETGSSSLPSEMVIRAVNYLGGTFDDLLQIAESLDGNDVTALYLAQKRLTQIRQPQSVGRRHPPVADVMLQRRVTAIEGVIHSILGLLKRILPDDAAEIERTSALWFKHVVAEDDKAP